MVLVLLVALVLSACLPTFDSQNAVIRYRLDVVFQLGGEKVTGSSVYQLTLSDGGGDGSGTVSRIVSRFDGQAIVIPLNAHPTLIIAMTTVDEDDFSMLFLRSCGLKIGMNESPAQYFMRLESFQQTCKVNIGPLKVLSIDGNDQPETLRLANNADLKETFGVDIKLISASLTPTTKAVTRGIKDLFPWLLTYPQVETSDYVLRKLNIGLRLSGNIFSQGT